MDGCLDGSWFVDFRNSYSQQKARTHPREGEVTTDLRRPSVGSKNRNAAHHPNAGLNFIALHRNPAIGGTHRPAHGTFSQWSIRNLASVAPAHQNPNSITILKANKENGAASHTHGPDFRNTFQDLFFAMALPHLS
jgi:hypothetical protein